MCLSAYFIKQGYPVHLLQEAALSAHAQDRAVLLNKINAPKKSSSSTDDVFLISTYHPHDDTLRDLIFQHWDFRGKSQTTEFLHKKHVMCGYHRLRDILMKANVPPLPGDERADPNHLALQPAPVDHITGPTTTIITSQKEITDFFKPSVPTVQTPGTSNATDGHQPTTILTRLAQRQDSTTNPGPSKFRGFNFCNRKDCRYCPLLNKSGQITCSVTGKSFTCMKNISCRSSNLIYAITCSRCSIQYVGQTMLRIKDRFVNHFYDITMSNMDKTVSKHFSQPSHNGIKDLTISVLEFTKKPPRCQ
jgi:hypothetical protein